MPTLESRRSVRYTVRPPLPATFGRTPVLICNFGRDGLQIEHEAVLNANQRGIVECEELDTRAEGRILWSRLLPSATVAGHYAYRSGVQLDDQASDRFERALAALLDAGRARADNDSLSRKQRIFEEKARQTQSQMFARPVTRAKKLSEETSRRIRRRTPSGRSWARRTSFAATRRSATPKPWPSGSTSITRSTSTRSPG